MSSRKGRSFEVVAVGQVQVLFGRARPAQQFVEKEPPGKPVVASEAVARMRHPEAEAQIQGTHEKGHRGSEVDRNPAHLRIERRGRCRQSGGKPQVVQFGGLIAQADAVDGEHGTAGTAVKSAQAIAGYVISRGTHQVQRHRLIPGDLRREGVFEQQPVQADPLVRIQRNVSPDQPPGRVSESFDLREALRVVQGTRAHNPIQFFDQLRIYPLRFRGVRIGQAPSRIPDSFVPQEFRHRIVLVPAVASPAQPH